MRLRLQGGLPFVSATILHGDQRLELSNVLLDTGSRGTVFASDRLWSIGLQYTMDDMLHRIRGVGGGEFVFLKRVDRLEVGEFSVRDFVVQAGAMDYGFEIDGILGMDFLTRIGAVIDLAYLEIHGGMASG